MQLQELAEKWLTAKHAEKEATAKRVEIEQQIIDVTGVKEEGAQTHEAGDLKITVIGKLNRKLDQRKWGTIKDAIPEQIRPVSFIQKAVLDIAGVRWLEENEPGYFKILSQAVTTKPAKTSVIVKEAK